MRTVRTTILGALAGLLAWGFASPGVTAQQQAPTITVRVSGAAWTYTHEQLLAMATDTLPNRTATRKNPAIPLSTILFKDTGLSPGKIQIVFLIASKITVLRGNDLAYLDRLVLKNGPDKGGRPHHWALAPKDEEAYKVVASHMGAPRKKGIYRIDILPKVETGG